jgi:hypothetical protein
MPNSADRKIGVTGQVVAELRSYATAFSNPLHPYQRARPIVKSHLTHLKRCVLPKFISSLVIISHMTMRGRGIAAYLT